MSHEGPGMMFAWRLAFNRAREEEGFTLVELLVVIGIFFVVLLGLIYTMSLGLFSVGLSRQRTTATGVANGVIEQVRALPYDTITLGMNSSDSAFTQELADPDGLIRNCSGVFRFQTCTGEELVVGSTDISNPPVVPHVEVVNPDPNRGTMTRRVYLTRVPETSSQAESYRVTVVVTSDSGTLVREAEEGVTLESLIFSPSGCLDTSTHPFAAPCEPFFISAGSVPPGTITVTGSILGSTFSSLTLVMADVKSSIQLEQVRRASGEITAPSVSLTDGGGQSGQGGAGKTSAADDDIGTSGADTHDHETLAGGAPTVQSSASGLRLSASASSSAVLGSTTSTVSATNTRTCPMGPPNPPPPTQNDSQPCSYSITPQVQGYDVNLIGFLGTPIPLVRIQPDTQPTSFSDHTETPTVVRSSTETRRSFSGIQLVAPDPSGLIPTAAVNVSSASSRVKSTVGLAALAPEATNSGAVVYWSGIGTATASITSSESTFTVGRTVTIPLVGSIQASGTFRTGGSRCIPDPCNAATVVERLEAEARVGSPIEGSLNVVVRDTLGGQLANLTITIDMGEISSRGTYRPTP